MDIAEKMAADIAVKLNGGECSHGKWYSEGHREAWIKAVQPYADEIERLREALQHIIRWHDQLSPADIAKAKAALKEGE